MVVFNAEGQKYPMEMLNLFYGTNESGKTTIFDGIVEAIFKLRDSRSDTYRYQRIYPKQFEIQVEIEMDEGNVIFTARDEDNLQKKLNFSHYYVPNLFCVRDTDIRWWNKRSEFGKQLMRDLSSQVDLNEVEKSTFRNMSLTPTGTLTDKEKNKQETCKSNVHRLKQELNDAKKYIDEFQKLQKEEQELINKIVESENKRKRIKQELQLMSDLKKREDLLKAKTVRVGLESNEKKLTNFTRYKEDDLKDWKKSEENKVQNEIKRKEMLREREELQSKLQKYEIDIARIDEQIVEGRRLKPSVDRLRNDIDKYLEESDKIFQKEPIMKYFPIVSVALFLASLFGFITSAFKLLFLVPVFIAMVVFIKWRQFNKNKNSARKFNETILDVEEKTLLERYFGEKISGFEGMKKMVNQFGGDLIGKESLLTEKKNQANILKNEILSIEKKIEEADNVIREQREKIMDYCARTSLAEIRDFEQKLKEKKEIEYEIKMKKEIITQILESSNEIGWDAKLKKLEDLSSLQGKWNEGKTKSLEREIEKMEKDISEGRKKREELHQKIVRLANSSAVRPPEKVLEDLKNVEEELTDIQNRYESGQLCGGIFSQLKKERGDPLKEICQEGGKDSLSSYFAMVTNQRYKEVKIRQREISTGETPEEEKIPWEIVAVLANGKEISLSQLSLGTRVPLYFLFRIKFVEKILQGKKGFILLDDPFLPCHSERLKNIVDLMYRLTQEGWQIIYFTIDEKIRNLLQKQKARVYELPEIPV